LHAIIGDHSFNAAQADGVTLLPKLLGNDRWRGLGIKKTIAEDLTHQLVGSAIVGLGPGFAAPQGGQTALLKGGKDLVIALAATTVFLGDGVNLSLQTLSLHEHDETASQLIVGRDGQRPRGAAELV
jgi:hypothetical protein